MTVEATLRRPLLAPPTISVAKVLQIHRQSGTIDIKLLQSGATARDIPVLGWGGSTFGLAAIMPPVVDRQVMFRKTYPEPKDAVEGLIFPAANTANFRDIYTVVVQIAGSQRGVTGFVALGFLFPQVSEMHFSGESFPDFLLFRHPSDVQVTVDQWGSTAIQHPAGGHILLENSKPTDEGEFVRPAPLDLTEQDLDQLYKLRANKKTQVPVSQRKTQLLLRIPKWILKDEEQVGEDFVVDGIKDTERERGKEKGYLPSPASFAVGNPPPVVPDEDTALIAEVGGSRGEVVRTWDLANGVHAIVVSPPLSITPQVGDTVIYYQVPVIEAGEVYQWHSADGNLIQYAVWVIEDPESGEVEIHGEILEEAGELHQEHVQFGDIIESAEGEDPKGNVRNFATQDWEAFPLMYGTLHSASGAKVQVTPSGDVNIIAPALINIIAGEAVNIVAPIINENSGGFDTGAGQGTSTPSTMTVGAPGSQGSEDEGEGSFPGMDGGGLGGGPAGGMGGGGMGGGMPTFFSSPF